ncbi:hypothetical protein PM8797T_13997 [Gimesia maris DSM 8797]|nr:hypothetical protein PM8797T_13997 [Gimesia maris DSM 8797]
MSAETADLSAPPVNASLQELHE